MRIIFLLLSAATVFTSLHGQQHDANWMTGYISQNPHPDYGGTLTRFWDTDTITKTRLYPFANLGGTTITYSDTAGSLLFFSEGCAIYTADIDTMVGSEDMNPGKVANNFCGHGNGYPGMQTMLALPMPKADSLVEVIYLHRDTAWINDIFGFYTLKLVYSTVNLNGQGGAGEVVEKFGTLLQDTLSNGFLTAVRHANGRDWWVVLAKYHSDRIYTILLGPDGFSAPIPQEIEGLAWTEGGEIAGNALFSPDGRTYARYDYRNGIDILDFDRCNGTFGNFRHIDLGLPQDSVGSAGLSFSPNSRFLYASSTFFMHQLDMSAPDIGASRTLLGRHDGFYDTISNHPIFQTFFFLGQLAPNGKIYWNTTNGTAFMHTVERPNRRGAEAQFKQHNFPLLSFNARSLPHFPNYRLGPVDGSACDSLGIDNLPVAKFRMERDSSSRTIHFFDLSYYAPETWHWDFGDGHSTSEQEPIHSYADPGTYRACLTVRNAHGSDTYCKKLYLGQRPEAERVYFLLFPNPVTGPLIIEPLDISGTELLHLRLYDVAGREVYAEPVGAVGEVHEVVLPESLKGMFVYVLTVGGRDLQIGKLVRM